jgi:hypothetical protein
MRGTAVVEIGSGDPVECSRRILAAFRSKSLRRLRNELLRASRVCQSSAVPGMAQERAELLDAIVRNMQTSISGHRPFGAAEISLLGHLAAA